MLLRLRKVNVSALPLWVEQEDEAQLQRLDCEWINHWKDLPIAGPSLPLSLPLLAESLAESLPGTTLPLNEGE